MSPVRLVRMRSGFNGLVEDVGEGAFPTLMLTWDE